jgi:hypothetical protein
MRAGPIVIFHVTEQQVTEVALAEYNKVVKAFPSDRTDQPFSISILPRGARRLGLIADAYRSGSADKNLTISAVPVANEIAGSLFPTACFRDLICDPFCGWVRCDHGLRAEHVKTITCRAAPWMIPIMGAPRQIKLRPQTAYHAKFSFYYTIAAALTFGGLSVEALLGREYRTPRAPHTG